jgi:hypothetical protein
LCHAWQACNLSFVAHYKRALQRIRVQHSAFPPPAAWPSAAQGASAANADAATSAASHSSALHTLALTCLGAQPTTNTCEQAAAAAAAGILYPSKFQQTRDTMLDLPVFAC